MNLYFRSFHRAIAMLSAQLVLATPVFAISINPNRCESKLTESAHADGRDTWAQRCLNSGNVNADELSSALNFLPLANQQADQNHLKHWYVSVYADSGSPLDLPMDANAGCVPIPEGYRHVALCQSGCFRGDQLILLGDGYRKIEDIAGEDGFSLVTLAPGSVLGNLKFTTKPVLYTTKSLDPQAHESIVTFLTEDGGSIAITPEHMLVDGTGSMREASTLSIGDELVRVDGRRVKIIKKDVQTTVGRVYHVTPDTVDDVENIIVAQGFLSGSHRWQVREKAYLNRLVLRSGL